MKRAIFLDRDGTINVEKNYLYRISDFEFLPGVLEGLKLLQDAGYILVIITNQSGIGRGFYTEQDFHILNKWMLQTLKAQGINIAKVYFCPHLPDAPIANYRKDCECRKPKLGMYLKAIQEFDIDIQHSYAIGDKIRDCAICEKTECRGFLIGNNEKETTIATVKEGNILRVKYAKNLLECAKLITNF